MRCNHCVTAALPFTVCVSYEGEVQHLFSGFTETNECSCCTDAVETPHVLSIISRLQRCGLTTRSIAVARSCDRIDCIAQADKMPQRSIMQLGFLYGKQLLTDIQRSSRFLLCCRRGSSRSCFLPRRCSTLQSLLQRLIRSERGLKKTHLRLLQPRLIAHSNVNATLTFHLTVRS